MSEENIDTVYTCEYCGAVYKTGNGLAKHIQKKHMCELNEHNFQFVRTAFRGKSDTGLRFYADIYKCLICDIEMEEAYHKT